MKNYSRYSAILLGILFAIAGSAKILSDLPSSQDLSLVLGVDERIAEVICAALPIVELAVAYCLITAVFLLPTVLVSILMVLAFAGFHILALVRFSSSYNCDCFGNLFGMRPIAGLVLTALMSACILMLIIRERAMLRGWKIVVSSDLKQKLLAGLFLVILVVGASSYRYEKIKLRSNRGLIEHWDKEPQRDRLGEIFRENRLLGDAAGAYLIVFLRSPGCDACVSELLFWNGYSAQRRMNLVAVFPTVGAIEPQDSLTQKMSNEYGIGFPVKTIGANLASEILGDHRPASIRVLFSSQRELIDVSSGGSSDVERKYFVQHLDSLLTDHNP